MGKICDFIFGKVKVSCDVADFIQSKSISHIGLDCINDIQCLSETYAFHLEADDEVNNMFPNTHTFPTEIGLPHGGAICALCRAQGRTKRSEESEILDNDGNSSLTLWLSVALNILGFVIITILVVKKIGKKF